MQGKAALPIDDGFARYDEAFAKLEDDLAVSNTAPVAHAATAQDLSEFDALFDEIDRRLAAHSPASSASVTQAPTPASSTGGAPPEGMAPLAPAVTSVPSRAGLALVTPPATALAEVPPSSTIVTAHVVQELWPRSQAEGTPLERLLETVHNLLWLQRAIEARSARVCDRVKWNDVGGVLADAHRLCGDFDLPTARVRAEFALAAFEDDCLDVLSAEIVELVRHIRHDLRSCSIWPIPRACVWAFKLELSDHAAQAFPSAAGEVTQAGRAAGFGLHDAAVFHGLRAARTCLRPLRVAARSRKNVACEWHTTLSVLETRASRARRWPRASRGAGAEFFSGLLHDARTLHDADRKLASVESFEESQAIDVVRAATSFVERLSHYVTEAQRRPLTRDIFCTSALVLR
jgi:hypothetical protein